MKNLVKMEFSGSSEYLTDAELESMILELEQHDIVPAPPDLQEQILEALEKEMPGQETVAMKLSDDRSKQERIRAFHKFRFQVLTTVAAAVLVVLLLPKFEELKQEKIDFLTLLQKQEYTQKQEYVMQSRYETKEEALNDSGMLETLLGGVNIFADNNRFNLFRK